MLSSQRGRGFAGRHRTNSTYHGYPPPPPRLAAPPQRSRCHCKKSKCLKKYCECFDASAHCGEECKCADCMNFDGAAEIGEEIMKNFAGVLDGVDQLHREVRRARKWVERGKDLEDWMEVRREEVRRSGKLGCGPQKSKERRADATSKGHWTEEEDEQLRGLVALYGTKRWSKIASKLTGRTNKSCRERWLNNLDPSISKSPWTEEEDVILVQAIIQSQKDETATKWVEISKLLPGRGDNSTKNRWHCLKKRVEQYIYDKDIDGEHKIVDKDGVYLLNDEDIEGCVRAARVHIVLKPNRSPKRKADEMEEDRLDTAHESESDESSLESAGEKQHVWSKGEEELLLRVAAENIIQMGYERTYDWLYITKIFPRFTQAALQDKLTSLLCYGGDRDDGGEKRKYHVPQEKARHGAKDFVTKGPWTEEEDKKLRELVKIHGTRWSHIARDFPGRTNKSCRERWRNYLDPSIKKSPWTEEEDRILLQAILQSQKDETGPRWVEISKLLPGRGDNSVKNRWYSSQQKKVERYIYSKNIDGKNKIVDENGVYLVGEDIDGCVRAAREKNSTVSWTEHEDLILLQAILQAQKDDKSPDWLEISDLLPGRSEGSVMQHWYSLQKKVERYIHDKNIDGTHKIVDKEGVYLLGDDIEGCIRATREQTFNMAMAWEQTVNKAKQKGSQGRKAGEIDGCESDGTSPEPAEAKGAADASQKAQVIARIKQKGYYATPKTKAAAPSAPKIFPTPPLSVIRSIKKEHAMELLKPYLSEEFKKRKRLAMFTLVELVEQKVADGFITPKRFWNVTGLTDGDPTDLKPEARRKENTFHENASRPAMPPGPTISPYQYTHPAPPPPPWHEYYGQHMPHRDPNPHSAPELPVFKYKLITRPGLWDADKMGGPIGILVGKHLQSSPANARCVSGVFHSNGLVSNDSGAVSQIRSIFGKLNTTLQILSASVGDILTMTIHVVDMHLHGDIIKREKDYFLSLDLQRRNHALTEVANNFALTMVGVSGLMHVGALVQVEVSVVVRRAYLSNFEMQKV